MYILDLVLIFRIVITYINLFEFLISMCAFTTLVYNN